MTPQAKKMTFFGFFSFSCTSTYRGANFLLLSKYHIFSRSEKSGGTKDTKISAKMTPQAKKMTFFRVFFLSYTSTHRGATFLLLSKFHIFSRSEKLWGDKGYKISAKMTSQAKKRLYSDFFFLLHIYTLRRNFFVFIKISYLQPFREIIGGQEFENFRLK